jgi:membrane protein YqaA with SNARE-associated domain
MNAAPQAWRSRYQAPAYAAMVRRVSSRASLWLGAGWAFAEATLFFIVPDVWLGFVALYAPRRMPVTLVAITIGAALGAVGLYLATLVLGDGFSSVLAAVPGIDWADLEQARSELADQGATAFLNGILAALPVKVYIHASALLGVDLPDVVVFTMVNRIERLLLFGLAMACVGWLGRPVVARWPRAAAFLYVLSWGIFYTGFLLGGVT